MDRTPLDLDLELQRHGAALHRLAFELVRDPAAAADAVQETWLHAARRAPRDQAQVGGWLVTVLRRVVARSRRGERRRTEREQAVAREPLGADHAESAARTELGQRLLAAVHALEPAHRDAIWQRYFEGLPPRTIAARSGVPVATVKSRLQRGLQQLRERLGEGGESSDWRGALALAFGFELPKGAAAVGTVASVGGVTMAAWTKVAAAAAVVTILAVWWWPWAPAADRAIDVREVGLPIAASTPATDAPAPSVERVAVAASAVPEAATPAVTPGAATARLRGRVVAGESGEPLAGIEIYRRRGIGDVRWEPDDTLQTTAADGRFEFEVVAGKTPGLMLRGPMRENCYWSGAILGAGQVADIGDLSLPAARRMRGQLVDDSRKPVAARLSIELWSVPPTATGTASRGVNALRPQVQSDDQGRFEVPSAVAIGRVRWVVSRGDFELAGPQETVLEPGDGPAAVELLVRPRPTIRGVVVDETGQPVEGVDVFAEGDSSGSMTTERGTFTLSRVKPADAVRVVVETPLPFAPVPPIDGVAWGTAGLRIALRKPPPIVIEVTTAAGEPLEEFGIVLDRERRIRRPGEVRERAHHPAGRLEVQGAVPGQSTLRVLPTARTWTPSEPLPVTGEGPLRFVVQPRLPCVVRVTSGGVPVADAAVQLVHERQRGGPLLDPHGDKAWIPRTAGRELVAEGTTDSHGDVSLLRDAQVEGRYLLIRAPGRPDSEQRDLVFPTDGSPLVVDLPSLGRIVGRVDLRGVVYQQVGIRVQPGGPRGSSTPQPDGSFEFRDVPIGTHSISLTRSANGRAGVVHGSERTLEVTAGRTTEVSFDLAAFPTSSVRGRLVGAAPIPNGLTIDFVRREGATLPEILGTAAVGADGSFRVADLLPGNYLLTLRTGAPRDAWLPAVLAETLVLLGGEEASCELPFRPRRLVVHFQRADGSSAEGQSIRARCGGEHWPGTLGILMGGGPRVSGPLVLDPAPVLPIEFRCGVDGSAWSAPVVMPPDRTEAEVTVVLPDPPH